MNGMNCKVLQKEREKELKIVYAQSIIPILEVFNEILLAMYAAL